MRKNPLSFFSKNLKFLLITILVISMFISCFNIPNVKASYGTEISGLTFNGWDTDSGNSISDGTYNMFVVDGKVLMYSNLGVLLHNLDILNLIYIVGNSDVNASCRVKLIEFNSTTIIVVSVILGSMQVYMKSFYLELSTGILTSMGTRINSGLSTVYTHEILNLQVIQTLDNNIYVVCGYMQGSASSGQSANIIYRIYPTQNLIDTYSQITNQGDVRFLNSYGAINVLDKINTDSVYIISRRNFTSYWIWHFKLTDGTKTYIGSFNDNVGAISSLSTFYTFKINEAYGIFNAGNYSLAFASSFNNASLNAVEINTVFFDGSSFLGVAQTLVDFTGSRTPIRIISKINQVESWVGSYSLIAVDGNRNYRNLDIYLGTNGIGLSPCRVNYGIEPIYGTLYTSGWGNFLGLFSWGTHGVEGWTYINYPQFYFTASNSIGGYQDVINSNIMFMIDYQNGKVNVQTTKVSVEGLATKLYISPLINTFNVYNGSYVNSFVATISFTKNWLGVSPTYFFNDAVYIGTTRLTSTVGYWSVYLSEPSQTPYTHEDVDDLLLQVPTVSGSLGALSNGYFDWSLGTGQPNANYYYQLAVVTASYKTNVNGTDVYLSTMSYVLIIGYRNGVSPIPPNLPDDYDIDIDDNTGTIPTPNPTPTSTSSILPSWLNIPDSYVAVAIYAICIIGFIYAFYSLHIGSGAISLIVGLAVATIICNILNLLGIWTLPIDALIVVVIAIIIYAGRS